MSDDKTKSLDENDRLKAGKLSSNAFDGTKPVAPLRAVENLRQIGEPADVAAEGALNAALLWAASNQPDALRATVVQDILPNGDAHYDRIQGDIYNGILACLVKDDVAGHTPVEHDPVAVASHIALAGKGRDHTSSEALFKLQAAASTVSHVQARAYAESIRRAWAKRMSIRDMRTIAMDALSPKMTDAEIFDRAQKATQAMLERANTTAKTVSIKQSAEQLFIALNAPGGGAVSTGIANIDTMLNGGIRPCETSILAARTSVGKSTLAVDICEGMLISEPTGGALYVCMEMPHVSLTTKLIAARSGGGITVTAIRRKALNKDQWSALAASIAGVQDLELHFTVSMTQTMQSVFVAASERQRLLKAVGKHLVIVVIDLLTLIKATSDVLKRGTRQQQIAETSRAMRWIANELGCHVMGLAHIHRDAERNKDSTAMPKLHQLREAGDLEQDADQIFIMHRPRDAKTGLFVKGKPTAVALAKERMTGETAITLLEYQNGRYVDSSKDFDDEYGESGDGD